MNEFDTILKDPNVTGNISSKATDSSSLPNRPTGEELDRHFDTTWQNGQTTVNNIPEKLNVDAGPDNKLRLAAIEAAENPLL